MDIQGYKTLSLIGRGAGSTIYKIKCIQTGKLFALKRVARENDPEGRFAEQIEVEYRNGKQISSPHVVKIHDLKRLRKLFRIVELQLVMQYLEGHTLESRVPDSPAAMVRTFLDVARGVKNMHEAGFVHADLKPSNVMRHVSGRVVLIDLGQSCRIGETKQRIQGTPDFIAPEQVMKMPLDERTDVFNVGATMYWCLTGRTYPTRLKSQRTGFNIDMQEELQSPHEYNAQVPKVFSNLVMDCCRNTPQNRPANMVAVIESLEVVQRVLERRPE
jgi:serine/threonine-protein kinase